MLTADEKNDYSVKIMYLDGLIYRSKTVILKDVKESEILPILKKQYMNVSIKSIKMQ